MNLDEQTVQRIVADVLSRLSTMADDARGAAAFSRNRALPEGWSGSAPGTSVVLAERVVTADLLAESVNGGTVVTVAPHALVTPAACDFLRERGLELRRADADPNSGSSSKPQQRHPAVQSTGKPLLIVVRNAGSVDRLWEDLRGTWWRELLGCPDDAARLAVSAISRGEVAHVVILADQNHRAACLANRNDRVNAVAIRDVRDVKATRKQFRANIWCVDPSILSYFELRTLIRALGQ